MFRDSEEGPIHDDQRFSAIGIFPDILSQLEEETILSLVKKLPIGYRAVFVLYVLEDKKHSEIAQMLDINESTSRSQLVKARRMLQTMITQHYKIAL